MIPPKTGEEKRDYKIEVRVTFAEKSTIQNRAKESGRSVSDYMRESSIGAKPTRRAVTPDRAILLKHLAEANKYGSNINQIAHALNRKDNVHLRSEALLVLLEDAINDHNDFCKRLIEFITNGY